MAWRPTENLIEGELDNTVRGKVTGWMRFLGMKEMVIFDLEGDFHRDIRGTKIRLRNPDASDRNRQWDDTDKPRPDSYMIGFNSAQKGTTGDITAGLPPQDYVDYPYIEWFGPNGRVVLELQPEQVEVAGNPIPFIEEDPISREGEQAKMEGYMTNIMQESGGKIGIVVGDPKNPVIVHKEDAEKAREEVHRVSAKQVGSGVHTLEDYKAECRSYGIPDRMASGLHLYFETHIQPGDFLMSVLCSDLKEAVRRADDENVHALYKYISFLVNRVPWGSWGSVKEVTHWLGGGPPDAERKA